MSKVHVWNSNDPGYERWISSHQGGFQANTKRPVGGSYYRIHTATCVLPDRSKANTIHPRTGNKYLKVTAEKVSDLVEWAQVRLKMRVNEANYCKRCCPHK